MSNRLKGLSRIYRIHKLINNKSAGTPDQLASKLGKNKRTIQRYISEMIDYGFPINLCQWRKTYYYTAEVEFDIKFKVFGKDQIDDIDKLKGGSAIDPYFHDFFPNTKKVFRMTNFVVARRFLCVKLKATKKNTKTSIWRFSLLRY